LDANAQNYYAAMVHCNVKDVGGNLVAGGTESDVDGWNGYAQVVLTFTGVPGATYTVTGFHSAVAIMDDYIDDGTLGPRYQNQWVYYDPYNFGLYEGAPAQYSGSYEWFGPGPEQRRLPSRIHTGNTTDTQIRYYTQSELQALITNAQAILSPHCDVVFSQVLVPTYTNQSFFNSLRVTAFLQYPLGVPPPPDIDSVADEPQADTLINQTDRPIRLFATFYPTMYGFTAGTQESVLTHEGIHHYTGWDDITVANRLNITPVGYGTQFISDWVQRGCVN
jgi:hypothetical protein